jgi:hypothetical protein
MAHVCGSQARTTVLSSIGMARVSDEVPVRLILGVDAEKRVHRAEAARASEAEKWRHLSVSTVFEDAESIPELLNH